MKVCDLFEARADFIAQQLGPKLVQRYQQDTHQQAEPLAIMKKLEQIHPRYVQWIANRYLEGQFKMEDASRLRNDLIEFDRIRPKLQVKDINQYKTLPLLYDALKPFQQQEVVSNKQIQQRIKRNGASKIYEDNKMLVYKLHTQAAACLLGSGTKWCTAATDSDNYFDYYNQRGPLYVFMVKGSNMKYQLHFELEQLMDPEDQEVDTAEFTQQYPEAMGAAALDNINNSVDFWDNKAIKFLPTKVQAKIVNKDYHLLANIPEERRTNEVCYAAWRKSPRAYYYFPDKLKTVKMSIATAKRVIDDRIPETYWMDLMPRTKNRAEHVRAVEQFFEYRTKLRQATNDKKSASEFLTKLLRHKNKIQSEHKPQYNELLDSYRQKIKTADENIRTSRELLTNLKQKVDKE